MTDDYEVQAGPEVACKWAGSDRPRILPGRHHEECGSDECAGCQPCTRSHCRVCVKEHAAGTCGGCLNDARDNLWAIQRMCDALPDEVEHKGVEGEAMNLLGPAADAEAWGHREASAKAGRIDATYLDFGSDQRHPLWVLGTWEMTYRDAFDAVTDERVTIDGAGGYLDRMLTEAAAFEWVPFEDMARELAACSANLENVLHDGEQVDRGVPCLNDGARLERVWGKTVDDDGWRCPRCHQTSSEDQYRLAVKRDYILKADWLSDVDMTIRTGVKAGTVRGWARETTNREALVRKKLSHERVVYSVADTMRALLDSKLAA